MCSWVAMIASWAGLTWTCLSGLTRHYGIIVRPYVTCVITVAIHCLLHQEMTAWSLCATVRSTSKWSYSYLDKPLKKQSWALFFFHLKKTQNTKLTESYKMSLGPFWSPRTSAFSCSETIAGSIGILLCCVLNDILHIGAWTFARFVRPLLATIHCIWAIWSPHISLLASPQKKGLPITKQKCVSLTNFEADHRPETGDFFFWLDETSLVSMSLEFIFSINLYCERACFRVCYLRLIKIK